MRKQKKMTLESWLLNRISQLELENQDVAKPMSKRVSAGQKKTALNQVLDYIRTNKPEMLGLPDMEA